MSCENTNTTTGLTKDVLLYHSKALADYCERFHGDRYRALKNAKTYTEYAFNQTGHDVTIDYITNSIQVNEQCWKEFTQNDPCTGVSVTWNSPKEYFKRYIECRGKATGGDQTFFLTNCDDVHGGVGGAFAWTQSGQNVANLPTTPSLHGTSNAYGGMSTVLHEMGHRWMQSACVNSDYSEHHYGRLGEYGFNASDHFETPMGEWGQINPSENACCQSHHRDGTTYWRMTWSECCRATWEC